MKKEDFIEVIESSSPDISTMSPGLDSYLLDRFTISLVLRGDIFIVEYESSGEKNPPKKGEVEVSIKRNRLDHDGLCAE